MRRSSGAVYRITITSPKLELPESRRAEFEEEADQLSQRQAAQDQWSEFADRRRAASRQVGTDQKHFAVTLLQDNARRLAFAVSDEDDRWLVEVAVSDQRLPKVELNGRIDLTALLKADGTPGCWTVAGGGALRARGIGRPVLWLAGRRVRTDIDRVLAEFWASSESRLADLELEMARLRTSIENGSGPAGFIRRALWDEHFDPGLESLRVVRDEP